MTAMSDKPQVQFGASAFKEAEKPELILILTDIGIRQTPAEVLANNPSIEEWQFKATWEDVARTKQDGSGPMPAFDSAKITDQKNSKMNLMLRSLEAAVGYKVETEDDLAATIGAAYVTQERPMKFLDRMAKQNGLDHYYYRHVIRVATQDDIDAYKARVAAQAAARSGTPARLASESAGTVVSGESAKDIVLGLIENGATTQAALKSVIYGDPALKSNSDLVGGVIRGSLLTQLIQEGRISADTDDIKTATFAVAAAVAA